MSKQQAFPFLKNKDIYAVASQAGVRIEMIVRGICCLIPEVKGYTEKFYAIAYSNAEKQ